MKALPLLTLALLGLGSSAPPAPSGTLAYLRGGAAWVQISPGQPAREVPHSRGAVLLDSSPASGAVAFMTGPRGADVHADRAPPLTPFLSKAPYGASVPLSALVPDPRLRSVRARWLAFEGDGRNLVAGTDQGTVGWDLVRRQSFLPNQTPFSQTTSSDGEVTATLGSVQSPDEAGVLLYGPGARPGTELFTRRQPQHLMRALKAAPQPAIRRFLADLDPRAQADDVSWVVTPPQVTRDGRRVYFASNVGWGVGSEGTTTAAVFEVDVGEVRVRVLGRLGTFSGSALDLRPSPDGQKLLILLTRHVSNVETPVLAYVADLGTKTRRELKAVTPPAGRTSVVDGACWLGDSGHLALSVAHPRPGDLTATNNFLPRSAEYALLILRAADGQVVSRVPGATGPTCGPRRLISAQAGVLRHLVEPHERRAILTGLRAASGVELPSLDPCPSPTGSSAPTPTLPGSPNSSTSKRSHRRPCSGATARRAAPTANAFPQADVGRPSGI